MKSTKNKRDVEFLAERKEVVGIVAHLDCVSAKIRILKKQTGTYLVVFEDKTRSGTWRKNLLDRLLYATESRIFVVVHSTSMDNHNAVHPQSHSVHHLAMILQLSHGRRDDFRFRAAELRVLARMRGESVAKFFGQFSDAREERCTIFQGVAVDCVGCKGKHLRGHAHKPYILI
jgi:hypothetical protein